MTEYFIYKKDNKNFALPVTSVVEIVAIDGIEDLGIEIEGCVGGIVNREKIVPIFDSLYLGLKKNNESASIKNVIVALCGDVTYGLTMDDFVGVDKLTTQTGLDETNKDGYGDKIVSSVIGYQKSTLIIFSPENISKIVAARIDEQTLATHNTELPLNTAELEVLKRPSTQFICFSIDKINLAIPIHQVREVIEEFEVTPVFNVHGLLRGLINLRGNVIACLDISNEIGLSQRSLTTETKYLIVNYKQSTIALCADVVHGIKSLNQNNIQKPDTVLTERQQKFVQGIYEDLENTLLLLSVADIFETEHLLEYTEMTNTSQ